MPVPIGTFEKWIVEIDEEIALMDECSVIIPLAAKDWLGSDKGVDTFERIVSRLKDIKGAYERQVTSPSVEKIKRTLLEAGYFTADELAAARLEKCYMPSTKCYGWHITPSGKSPLYLGFTVEVALDHIAYWQTMSGEE